MSSKREKRERRATTPEIINSPRASVRGALLIKNEGVGQLGFSFSLFSRSNTATVQEEELGREPTPLPLIHTTCS